MRILLLLIAVLAMSASANVAAKIIWYQGSSLPSARDHLGYGVVGGKFVVAGGAYWQDDSKRFTADTVAYSPRTGKWTRLVPLPISSAYGASAVYHDQLIVAGGLNETGGLRQCIRLVSAQGKQKWERLPDLPYAVAGACGAIIGHTSVVAAGAPGVDEAGVRSAYHTLLELDLRHPTKWIERPLPETLTGRIGAASAAVGDRLYLFGGYGVQADGTLGNFADAWVLYKGVWKQIRSLPVKTRFTTALPLDSHRIGLFGGYGDNFLSDVYVYDTRSDAYTKSTDLPKPICNVAGGVIGSTIYLAGGEDKQRHRSAELVIGRIVK